MQADGSVGRTERGCRFESLYLGLVLSGIALYSSEPAYSSKGFHASQPA